LPDGPTRVLALENPQETARDAGMALQGRDDGGQGWGTRSERPRGMLSP
jgi:hypothetical protein